MRQPLLQVEELNFRKSPAKRRKIRRQFRAACGEKNGNAHFKARAQYKRNRRVSFIGKKQLAKIAKRAATAA